MVSVLSPRRCAVGDGGGIAIAVPADVQPRALPGTCKATVPTQFWPYTHDVNITLVRVRFESNSVAEYDWSLSDGA